MMERICRTCGGVYRGLVCQACHPRGSGSGTRRREGDEAREARRHEGAEGKTGLGDGGRKTGDGVDEVDEVDGVVE
jgi:hypothetical protein